MFSGVIKKGRVAGLTAKLLSCLLALAAGAVSWASAGDSAAAGSAKSAQASSASGRQQTVSISCRRVPLERVLDQIARAANKNIRIIAESEDERLELERLPITLELDNVTWQVALQVLAKENKMTINNDLTLDNVIQLERSPRITMDVVEKADKPTPISHVINTIAKYANVNIIIGPEVKADVKSLKIHDVPWREALTSILKSYGFVLVEEGNGILRVTTSEKVKAIPEVRVFALRYVGAEGARYQAKLTSSYVDRASANTNIGASLISVLDTIKSKDGKITYESRTNRIIVVDAPTNIAEMARLINEIDTPPLQVQITTRMLTISDTGSDETGVNWANGLEASLSGGSYQTAFPFTANNFGELGDLSAVNYGENGPISASTLSNTAGTTTYTLGTMDFSTLSATLQFVKTSKNIKLLQAPQIVAIDNEEATIYVGDVIRYATMTTTSDSGVTTTTFTEATPISTGVQLLVVPHVTADGQNVMLTIVPKTEDFTGWKTYTASNVTFELPQTSSKIVVTKMLLGNNETGVIGGLISDEVIKQVNKVPLLGDIPVLGYMFKRDSNSNTRKNVVILVTPQIIRPNSKQEFNDTINNVRGKFGDETLGLAPKRGTEPMTIK